MTTEYISSAEMIERAKESLRVAKEDFLPKENDGFIGRGMSPDGVDLSMGDGMPAAMGDGMPAGMSGDMTSRAQADRTMANAQAARSPRSRRVASSTQEHLVVAPTSMTVPSASAPAPAPAPAPPSPFTSGSLAGSGRWMRILGNIILGFVAVIWGLLLIGLIDSPGDLGETVGGGTAITLVPLLFGLVLRRAGKRRGIAV